ncbi:MAG: hypothetical protein LUF28_09575 [Clostridiales bacterium]|nr:hypothetical protein [Clostridiales bacterium]
MPQMQYQYRIQVQTPMGMRRGFLELALGGPALTGVLTVMGRREPVEGVLNRDGSCTIYGRLRAVSKEFSFSAVGRVDCQKLTLTVTSGRSTFQVTGIACPRTEGGTA